MDQIVVGDYPITRNYVKPTDRTRKVCNKACSTAKRTLIPAQDTIKRTFQLSLFTKDLLLFLIFSFSILRKMWDHNAFEDVDRLI